MRRNSRLTAIAGFAVAVILLAAGGLLLWGSTYVHNTVQGQLSAQQIYFPPKAAFAHPKAGTEITPSMIPSVSQYAGQQLLTGQQAEAYADHFIAVHIAEHGRRQDLLPAVGRVAGAAEQRQAGREVATVFKGETLRSMLLNAYGWWKVSQITYIAAIVGLRPRRPGPDRLAVRADPGAPPRDHPRGHPGHGPDPRHDRMTPPGPPPTTAHRRAPAGGEQVNRAVRQE